MTTPKRFEAKLSKVNLAMRNAETFTNMARSLIIGDVDGKDLESARSELANASNAIDEAMGLINELMAPESTREEIEP